MAEVHCSKRALPRLSIKRYRSEGLLRSQRASVLVRRRVGGRSCIAAPYGEGGQVLSRFYSSHLAYKMPLCRSCESSKALCRSSSVCCNSICSSGRWRHSGT